MRKHTLFSRFLVLAFCAVLLVSYSVPAYAASENEDNPTVIDSLPYSVTLDFYKIDTGKTKTETYVNSATGEEVTKEVPIYDEHCNYYFKYVAEEAGRVTIKMTATGVACTIHATVNGKEVGYVYSEGAGSMYVDMRAGETLRVKFSSFAESDTTATMSLTMAPSPLGSKYKPYQTDASELAEGIKVDLEPNDSVFYSIKAEKDGIMRFYTNGVYDSGTGMTYSLPYQQQIVFAEKTTFAFSQKDCMVIVSAGDEILIEATCPGYAVGGSYTLYMQYTSPIFLSEETKAKLFNGMYTVDGISSLDGTAYTMYGVRFSYGEKKVSAIDIRDCVSLGTYNFVYNESNGALELSDDNGNPAGYAIVITEDLTSEMGAGLRLVYSGSYLLNRCTVAPEPNETVKQTLTGKYENIYKGKMYEVLEFDYDAGTVAIAPDWETQGEVYSMGEFDVFTGKMEITSESGKIITIGVRKGKILYYNNPLTPVEAPHIHEYTSEVTAPTCTEDGYTTFTCECGDTYTGETVATSGHAYEDVVTAPTCTEGGFTTHTCSVCADVQTDSQTEAIGHAYSAWADAGETHDKVCANCNDVQSAPHNWNDGETVKEPTEDTDGELLLTCADCAATRTQVIPNLGHTHKHEAVVTAPTCTADGYTTYTCKCGDSYTEAGEKATGHSYTDAVTAPTCTEAGYTTHTCANCGHSYQDSKINAAGHSYNQQVTMPTCTADGYTTYTCATCGHSYQDHKVLATGHSYDDGVKVDNTITYTCATCGDQYDVEISTNAFTVPGNLTGLVNGSQDYAWVATEDGFLIVDNVSALTGVYTIVTINGVEVYATENGYPVSEDDAVVITVTTYSPIDINVPVYMKGNEGAGLEDGAMEFDATFSGWTLYEQPWKAPFDGIVSFIITESNVNMGDLTFRVIDAEGQFYNQYEFGLDAEGRQYVSLEVTKGEVLTIVAYEDTMSADGQLHISVMEGKPAPHEHTYGEGVVTEPTCTADGYTTFTCTVCGHSYTDHKVTGAHVYEAVVTEPTCTEGGYTTYTCTVCGDSYVESGDKALYHSYGEWEIVQEATTTEPGLRKQTCTRCGVEETEQIPVIEQTPTTVPATQPATEPETQPATTGGSNATQPQSGSGTLVIVMVAAIVVIGGAIAAVLVIKKKK